MLISCDRRLMHLELNRKQKTEETQSPLQERLRLLLCNAVNNSKEMDHAKARSSQSTDYIHFGTMNHRIVVAAQMTQVAKAGRSTIEVVRASD